MPDHEWNRLPGREGHDATAGHPLRLPPPRNGTAPQPARRAADPSGGPADLRRYWEIVRTHWRMILVTCGVVVAAVTVGTLLQTPVYRASGMMEMRRQGSEVVPVEALFQANHISSQYLQTQYEILRSPALARRVIGELRMMEALPPEARPEQSPQDSAALVERMVADFSDRLFVEPLQGSYLVRVQFEASDPEMAARVVNSVFENYTRLRVEAARTAVGHLDEQVAAARAGLGGAEARLNEYVRANKMLVVANVAGERENIPHERLRQLQQELTAAEAVRYEKESRYNLLSTQGVDALSSEVLRSLSLRSAELRGEYASLRSTFTDEYPRTLQVKQQLDTVESQLSRERQRIATEIRDEYLAALERQQLLRAAFDEQQIELEGLSDKAADYYVLQRDVKGQRQLFSTLQESQKAAEVSAALAAASVDVMERASPPQRPVRPTPKRNVQLAVLVGLMLGVGLAVVRELTGSVTPILEEVDAQSVPILGMIPSIRSLQEQSGIRLGLPGGRLALPKADAAGYQRIDQGTQPHAVLTEAFGALRTSVLVDTTSPAPRCLLITSTQPGEGKTTISSNLAISLTRLDRRVLLIDADLRRPAVHQAFGVEATPGLADALTGSEWFGLVRPSAVPGLDLLTSGRPPERPSELLSSARMVRLLQQARATYDFVILDSPALMIHAPDARVLAPMADGTIVVVRGGATSREHVRLTLRQVRNIVGVVLNHVDIQRHFPAWYQSYDMVTEDDPVQVVGN